MDQLAKISQLLALKRSQAERDVAESKMRLLTLGRQLEAMEMKILNISAEVFSGAASDNAIEDAIILEQWRDMALGKIRMLHIQKRDIHNGLAIEKQTLKEIFVKEDVVSSALKAKCNAHEQERLEAESAARLENWILTQSCLS